MYTRFACLLLLAAFASPVFAQADQVMPPIGGPGGGPFTTRCARNAILDGFSLSVGDDVDSIAPICRAAHAQTGGNPRSSSDSVAGTESGTRVNLVCPDVAPAVVGVDIGYEGEDTVIVNNVHVFCGLARPDQPLTTYPTALFDGKPIGFGGDGLKVALSWRRAVCPPGLVAVGINGRAGRWVDAVSLVCGALPNDPATTPFPPEPVTSIGRVNTGPSVPRPPRPICDSARDALSRQSPAAPNLVTQCRAAGGNATAGPTNADLETARLDGEYRCSMDDAAAELRNRFAGFARRGFEIGLGIWADQTAPGPGKQRYHDAVTSQEQQGFDLAAAYALPKNKYAHSIGVGVAIARADAAVAAGRKAEPDPFFSQGFDIASGLFGDPAKGSEGSKVMGPGAMAIRNSLGDAGRRGFDASTKLHLSRTYR